MALFAVLTAVLAVASATLVSPYKDVTIKCGFKYPLIINQRF